MRASMQDKGNLSASNGGVGGWASKAPKHARAPPPSCRTFCPRRRPCPRLASRAACWRCRTWFLQAATQS
jgi:hypothetical protein